MLLHPNTAWFEFKTTTEKAYRLCMCKWMNCFLELSTDHEAFALKDTSDFYVCSYSGCKWSRVMVETQLKFSQ